MKRRLRKKKHLGEFQQLGFIVNFTCRRDLSPSDMEMIQDRWFENFCKPRGFERCGIAWLFNQYEAFVCRPKGSATDWDRKCAEDWLKRQPEVVEVHVGPLIDAWYDPSFEEPEKLINPDRGPFLWMAIPEANIPTSLEMYKAWLTGCLMHFGHGDTWAKQKAMKLGNFIDESD